MRYNIKTNKISITMDKFPEDKYLKSWIRKSNYIIISKVKKKKNKSIYEDVDTIIINAITNKDEEVKDDKDIHALYRKIE